MNSLSISIVGLPATDLLGLPRVMDGNHDGVARVHLGAYESNPCRFEAAVELSADGFTLTVRGDPGKTVRIDVSRDLVHWEPVATVPLPASGQTLIDPDATTERMLLSRRWRLADRSSEIGVRSSGPGEGGAVGRSGHGHLFGACLSRSLMNSGRT